MDSFEIIDKLATEKALETIVENVARISINRDDTLKDLSQMLYLDLLEKDPKKIEDLYESGQLQYFLTRMVINNIESKNSPYYYTYKKYQMLSGPIDSIDVIDNSKSKVQ